MDHDLYESSLEVKAGDWAVARMGEAPFQFVGITTQKAPNPKKIRETLIAMVLGCRGCETSASRSKTSKFFLLRGKTS